MLYDSGDYLFPHRDKWKSMPNGEILGDSLRLICWANNCNQNEFTFIHDGKLVKFEPRRWYAVNTRKIHSGFCFKDGTVHLACGIHLYSLLVRLATHKRKTQKSVTQWLLDVLPFAQPPKILKASTVKETN